MALDFPNSPTPGALFSTGGASWSWDGIKWKGNTGTTGTGSVVNVLDLGAKGDGSTNDTPIIQNALTTYAGKAVVFIPDTGQPYIVDTLVLSSGADLLLHGTLKVRADSGTAMQAVNGEHDITVRGHGTIDCNGANQTGLVGNQAGFYMYRASNVQVSGITIKNSLNWNVNVVQSSHIRFDSVSLIGGVNSNEFVGGGIGATDCWIVNSYIEGVANDSGFTFYSGLTNCGMSNCTISSTYVSAVGVYADTAQSAPCSHISITDNIFLNNTQYCIAVMVGDGITTILHDNLLIANNICFDNGHFSGAPTAAIWIDYCDTFTITDNLINYFGTNAAQTYGIYLGSHTTNIHVTDNMIMRIGNGGPNAAGLGLSAANYMLVSGNYFANIAMSITGYIGLSACIIGNQCNNCPISGITTQPDTFMDNIVNGRRITTIPSVNAANDTAAASAGVQIGEEYRNGSVKMIRVT